MQVTVVVPTGNVVPEALEQVTGREPSTRSVAVGADGTAYALAIEPEASAGSSGTILAIAPDSTVRYASTIIDR